MTVTGNNTRGGKDGVFVGDQTASGITISGNAFRGPQRAVSGTRWRSITPGGVNNGGSGTVLADNVQF